MPFIEALIPGEIGKLTFIGGIRAVGANVTYSFSRAYDNVLVVSFTDSNASTVSPTITYPSGSTYKTTTVSGGTFSNGRGLCIIDLHNVKSGTTITTQWATQWGNLYLFYY